MRRLPEFYGFLIYMYYQDHAPPHFPAIYGEYEAEMAIGAGEILQGSLPRGAR